MINVTLTRSPRDPERYWLEVVNNDDARFGMKAAVELDWQALEKLNREIVKLRTEDDTRKD